MKRSTLLLVLILFSVGTAQAGQVNSGTSVEAEIDEVFAPWDSTSSPGCALAVIQDGDIIYSKGYGMANMEHGVAIAPTSVFYVGSVSKQFVAMSIALLAEEGKLSLDDDIRKYVPEVGQYGRPITIQHLIHHTSGLRDYLTLLSLAGRSFADSITEEEVIDLIGRQKELNFTPGEEHLYSNSGYFLLAIIVNRASGKTLRAYTAEKIFVPLGMRNSHFHDDHTMLVDNRAEGHVALEGGGWGLTRSRFALVGSGGLYTTVEDLYLWDRNFYDNRLGEARPSLLSTILTRGRLNDGEELDYAFGLNIADYRGLATVRHGGALGGYRSHLIRFPDERFSVAITCNLDDIDPGALADRVVDIYLADRLKQAKPRPTPSSSSEPSQDDTPAKLDVELDAYVGAYESDELAATYRLFTEDGDLFLQIRKNPKELLRLLERDVLHRRGVKLNFQRDGSGRITGFVLNAGRVRNLRFVRK